MGASLVESVSVTTPQTANGDRLTTTTTYVPQTGWPVRSTDANKLVTTAEYDALGRLASVRYPQHAGSGPASIQYEYEVNARGQNAVVTRTLGADGKTQHVKAALYDGLLRVFQTQDENPAVTTKGQTAAQRGTVLSHTYYDSAGRVKKVAGPWVVSKTVPSAVPQDTPSSSRRVTTYRYDKAGRVTDEIVWHNTTSNSNNEKFRTVTLYDGRYTTVVPPQGGTASTTIVDGRGRTVAARQYTTRPTVQITLNDSTVSLDPRTASSAGYVEARYTYTRAGQLKSVVQDSTTSESPTWTYTYDKAGRKVSSQDPDNGTTRTVYDAVDQVVQVTDARGYSTSTTYDQLGRKTAVVGKTSAGATLSTATFVYDTAPLVGKERLALGQLASSSRTIGSDVYTTAVDGYDVAGRPTSTTVTLPAVGALSELENRSFTTAYTYMADGQVESVALPAVTTEGASGGESVLGAETVRTYYDQASKPRWMAGGFGWGTYVADSSYDFIGQPNALDLGTTYGAAVAYSYDDLTRRLTGVALMREQIGGTDLDVTYTYDDAGNLTSAVDEPGNTALGVHRCDVQNFRYDGLRRLTRAWTANDTGECAKNATNAISSSPAPYDVAYTYDVLDNRTTATATGVNGAVTTTRYTYSSTRPHQLLAASTTGAASATATYAYDPAGHQSTRTTNGSKVDLTWDAEGELTSVGTDTSAVYDANGDRLVRVDGTGTTVYLPGGQELSISGGKVTATRYYTFAGQSVAVRTGRGLGGVTSLVADMHGTTLAAVPNGSWKTTSVIKQYTDPFGATRGTPVTVPGDRQFLDKTRDQTGLTLIGARYYDEHTGRFISLDPLLDLSDPQQWNGYAYANNNPTTWSDPTGLDPDTSAWIRDRTRTSQAGRPSIAEFARAPYRYARNLLWDSNGESVPVNLIQSQVAGLAYWAREIVVTGARAQRLNVILPEVRNPNAGKGLIYDLQFSYGTIAPDLALAAATGGAGAPVGVARTGSRIASLVGRIQRLFTAGSRSEGILADTARIEAHLARLDSSVANDAMLARLRSAAAEGRSLTAGERNFVKHELTEAELMDTGMGYERAHEIAGRTHPTFANYDPEVIKQFPELFNRNWRAYWGIE